MPALAMGFSTLVMGAMTDGVTHVVGARSPVEVGRSVVDRVAVAMADLVRLIRSLDEGDGDNAVDVSGSDPAVIATKAYG